jgi:Neocarzinostatin family
MADVNGGLFDRFLRMGPGPRRGLFLAGLTVALLVAVLPAGADTPEGGGTPGASLTVTPDDNLSDGHVVSVSGAGFPANIAGQIRQCRDTSPPACDTTRSESFITNASGQIPPTDYEVRRIITAFGPTTFNCSTQACALVAEAGGANARHHITILGAGTVTSPTTAGPPTTSTSTTNGTPTTAATTTNVPPTSVTTTTLLPPAGGLICDLLRGLRGILGGFLAPVFDALLNLFGCPPVG